DANVRIVDMRQNGQGPRVPGAVYLSPVAIRDAKAAPTFLPTPAAFETMMASLGIGDATRVIVYDERGGIYAARLWWILNYYGHPNVALMNGGWIKWTAEHRPTAAGTPAPAVSGAAFVARADPKGPAPGARRHRPNRTARHRRDRQGRHADRRRPHRRRDRRQGSAQHPPRRVRALVDPRLLGRPARPAAEDLQARRRAAPDLRVARHPAEGRSDRLLPGRH